MNEWMRHLYSALLCIVVHPKRFTIIWGGLSSTTNSVQHPLGWCDGSHRTTAPVRSPHTSYRWRGERDRANQVDEDYWEAMIDKGQWREWITLMLSLNHVNILNVIFFLHLFQIYCICPSFGNRLLRLLKRLKVFFLFFVLIYSLKY